MEKNNIKKDQYKHLLSFVANITVLLIEGLSFSYFWYTYYVEELIAIKIPFAERGNWAIIAFYILTIFLITNWLNGYKVTYLRVADLWLSHIIAIGFGAIAGYLLVALASHNYLSPEPIVNMVILQIILIMPWIFIMRKVYGNLYPPCQMVLIYGNYEPDDIIEKMSLSSDDYNVCSTVSIHEGLEHVYSRIAGYSSVILADLPAKTRNDVLKHCYERSIRVYVTSKISDIILNAAEKIQLSDTPFLLTRSYGLNITQTVLKRAFDIASSIIGIAVLSPFMILVSILINAYDKGPVFYRQDRLTKDGKIFKIFKFRSMFCDSEKEGIQLAKKEDDRVTPIGKIIRRTHFDEIPQLFNILAGDMSLVGPRPERPEIVQEYKKYIPEFDFRLKVKAGLTGYAQVYGKYNTMPIDKLKFDVTYIENYSIWLDLKIIPLTFKALFQPDRTEGIEEDQVTALKDNK